MSLFNSNRPFSTRCSSTAAVLAVIVVVIMLVVFTEAGGPVADDNCRVVTLFVMVTRLLISHGRVVWEAEIKILCCFSFDF